MRELLFDLRFVLRQLRNSLGFALTAVLMLAFGIGATTAIFSIVEGVLLRPLPFPDSEPADGARGSFAGRQFWRQRRGRGHGAGHPRRTRGTRTSFRALGGYQYSGYELSGNGEPAQVNAARLTAGVFPALGVAPLLGRVFTADEDEHKPAGRGAELCDLGEPLPCRSADSGHEDPARSQAVCGDRGDAAQLRVSAGDGAAEPHGVMGSDELQRAGAFCHPLRRTGATRWSAGSSREFLPSRRRAMRRRVAQEIMRNYPAMMANLHISCAGAAAAGGDR